MVFNWDRISQNHYQPAANQALSINQITETLHGKEKVEALLLNMPGNLTFEEILTKYLPLHHDIQPIINRVEGKPTIQQSEAYCKVDKG